MAATPGSPAANVVWLDEVDSTNGVAGRLVSEWLAAETERLPDTVVVAARQTAGRGRSGRSWTSPPGGLYATWLAWLPSRAVAMVPMAVAVALVGAIEELAPELRINLKWPNDLQVGGRKLGGILCESRQRGEAAWVIAGFGINVDAAPDLAPGDATKSTSLRSVGYDGSTTDAIDALLAGFLARIRAALDGPAATVRAWVARTVHRAGDRMRIRLEGGVVEGNYVRMLDDGQLELRVDGELRRFASGELLMKSEPGG